MLTVQHPNGKTYDTDRETHERLYKRRGFEIVRDYSLPEPEPPRVEQAADEPEGVEDDPEATADAEPDEDSDKPDIPPPSQLERWSSDRLRELAAAYDIEDAHVMGKAELVELLTVMRTPPPTVNGPEPEKDES